MMIVYIIITMMLNIIITFDNVINNDFMLQTMIIMVLITMVITMMS